MGNPAVNHSYCLMKKQIVQINQMLYRLCWNTGKLNGWNHDIFNISRYVTNFIWIISYLIINTCIQFSIGWLLPFNILLNWFFVLIELWFLFIPRINLSPFTKDFRGEEQYNESIDLFFNPGVYRGNIITDYTVTMHN